MVYASKDGYRSNYDIDIFISDKSMSIEIIRHLYTDSFANYLPRWLTSIIQNQTSIIDSVDQDCWIRALVTFVLYYYYKIVLEKRNGEKNQEIFDVICNQNRMISHTKLDKDVIA